MILSFPGRIIKRRKSGLGEGSMNTPTHVMISLAALTRRGDDSEPTYATPAVAGALIPDAPMFAFYGIEKFVLGSSERAIWTTRYFLPQWQDFFDLFNSMPIAAAGLFIAWRAGRFAWCVFFGSMLLHILCDLPLHHDDGHRHFWPLSDWRFASPVSYWDVNHNGRYAAIGEALLFIVCYVVVMKRHEQFKIRAGATLLMLVHMAFIAMAVRYWVGL